MTHGQRKQEIGAVNPLILTIVLVSIIAAAAIAAATWGILSYAQQKTNVDTMIQSAVATAQKAQADKDEANFNERDKQPNRQFIGPEDYGRLTFNYPKTWSVYIAKTVVNAGDTFQAYLNPVSVPPISDSQQFALRVTIANTDYDKTLATYTALVQKGTLKSSTVAISGTTGTRLDGNFTQDIRGSAVVFKIRDKTVTIRSDADTFKPDFDALVATIKFNS